MQLAKLLEIDRFAGFAGLCLLLSLPRLQAHSQAQKRDADPDWVSSAQSFFRRAYSSSIVLGDYLYLDGGVVQYQSGDGSVVTIPTNSTYSIPLTASWAPRDVHFTKIDKGQYPVYIKANFWPAANQASFYAFYGSYGQNLPSQDVEPPSVAGVWQFQPDNSGGGAWSLSTVAPSSVKQSYWAGSTDINGTAYFLGGIQTRSTTPELYGTQKIRSSDGLVSFDADNQAWLNQSIAYSYPNGWLQDPQLAHLAGIGDGALLLAMGGQTSTPGPDLGDSIMIDYTTVAIYNTATNQWQNQTTTGEIPVARGAACFVGVQGDQGTFEIFLYGGYLGALSDTQSSVNENMGRTVYVLSIPSFSWHQASYDPTLTVRAYHSCNARNRQMVSIGGIQSNIDSNLEVKDPWPLGLEIFDLTDLVWKQGYDANAQAYVTPQLIKQYVAANGSYPKQWNDKVVEQWIAGSAHHSHTGAIVGGVVGGLGGALLLGGLAWFLIVRKRKRRMQHQDQARADKQQGRFEKSELGATQENSTRLYEKAAQDRSAYHGDVEELKGRPVHEKEGSRVVYEKEGSRVGHEMKG